jgi:chromosome segregation ATPase
MSAPNNGHELKALQTRLAEARTEETAARDKLNRAAKELGDAEDRRASIEARIRELTEAAKEPIVTEHALLRYIERFMGVDLESVRRAILIENAVKLIRFTKTGKINTDGRRLIVKNGTVVTIEPTEKEAA